jgi:uncharacterized protein (DUF1501 family)
MWSRREAMTGALGCAAAAGLAAAPTSRPRNLVVVVAWGGWDTTVGLDPKPGGPAPLPPGSVATYGDIDVWAAEGWPSLGRCMARWSPITRVVRGIAVRSVAHVVCHRRLLTGTPDPTAPDLGAVVGATTGAALPVPYLLLGVRAQPGSLSSVSATVGLSGQLATLAADAPADPALELEVDAWLRAADERFAEASFGPAAARRADELAAARVRAEMLSRRPVAVSGAATMAGQVEIAVAALAAGVSRAVTLDAMLDFDTHVDNVRQPELTDALFAGVDDLLTRLQDTPSGSGRTLLDDTTVLLTSEMTRTPAMNAGGGKDHWPFAVAALFGGDVRAGVSGGTDDQQAGVPVDLDTGEPGSSPLLAENWFAGVLEHVGVDPGPWSDARPLLGLTA